MSAVSSSAQAALKAAIEEEAKEKDEEEKNPKPESTDSAKSSETTPVVPPVAAPENPWTPEAPNPMVMAALSHGSALPPMNPMRALLPQGMHPMRGLMPTSQGFVQPQPFMQPVRGLEPLGSSVGTASVPSESVAKEGGAVSSTALPLPDGMTEEDVLREATEKAEEALKKLPEAQHEKMRPLLIQRFKKEVVKTTTVKPPKAPPKAPPPAPTPRGVVPKAGPHDGKPIQISDGTFQDILEINDYPEVVRRQVSHRELIYGMEEKTGSKLQVKGMYTPKGNAPPGYKKLYVEVTHSTAMGCTNAKRNLRRELEEIAKRTLNIPGIGNARNYNPITGANHR